MGVATVSHQVLTTWSVSHTVSSNKLLTALETLLPFSSGKEFSAFPHCVSLMEIPSLSRSSNPPLISRRHFSSHSEKRMVMVNYIVLKVHFNNAFKLPKLFHKIEIKKAVKFRYLFFTTLQEYFSQCVECIWHEPSAGLKPSNWSKDGNGGDRVQSSWFGLWWWDDECLYV